MNVDYLFHLKSLRTGVREAAEYGGLRSRNGRNTEIGVPAVYLGGVYIIFSVCVL